MHIPARLSLASALALAALTTAGCSDDSNEPNDPGIFLGATVTANPNNTISAVVSARAGGYDSVSIRYWKDGGDPAETPAVRFGTDSLAEIPVFGLDTLSTYALQIRLWRPAGGTRTPDTLAFTTGEYPAWIPRAQVAGANPSDGFLLVSYPDGPVILDNTGKIVWYRFQPGGVLGSWQAQANGLYTWLNQADSSGYYVFDTLGDQIGRISCVGFKTRFHDLMVLANGERWIMCDQDSIMDLSAVGGVAGAHVTASVVQRQSAAGDVLWEWRTLDHFAITDAPLAARNDVNVNLTHSNGIGFDTDGNLLLSSRTLNEVTKINVTTGDIIWRLGGLANQFTFVDDPKDGFLQQHGVRAVGPDVVQLLDNGTLAPSRLVRYVLNPTALTATLDLDFRDGSTFTPVGGSTQGLVGGGALVSFGRKGRVVEVDASGAKTFELTGIDDIYVFRAQRLASLYFPGIGAEFR
jgi:hypothetical protein